MPPVLPRRATCAGRRARSQITRVRCSSSDVDRGDDPRDHPQDVVQAHVARAGPRSPAPARTAAARTSTSSSRQARNISASLLIACCSASLRVDVVREPVQPGGERLPGRRVGEVRRGPAEILDLPDVDGLEQVLTRREVAVQRPDPHVRAARDVLQRRVGAVRAERLPRGDQQRIEVAPRVGAVRAPGGNVVDRGNGADMFGKFRSRLEMEDSLRYSGGKPPDKRSSTSTLPLVSTRRIGSSLLSPAATRRSSSPTTTGLRARADEAVISQWLLDQTQTLIRERKRPLDRSTSPAPARRPPAAAHGRPGLTRPIPRPHSPAGAGYCARGRDDELLRLLRA